MKKWAIAVTLSLFIFFLLLVSIYAKIPQKEVLSPVAFNQIASIEKFSYFARNFVLKDGNFLIAKTRDANGIKIYLLDAVKNEIKKINTIKIDSKGDYIRQTQFIQLDDDKFFAQFCYNSKATYPLSDLTCSYFVYDYKNNSYRKLHSFKNTEFIPSIYYLKGNYLLGILSESTLGKENSKVILFDSKNDFIKQSVKLKEPLRYRISKIDDNLALVKAANYNVNIFNPTNIYNIKTNKTYVTKNMNKIKGATLLNNGLYLVKPKKDGNIQLYDIKKDEIETIASDSKFLSVNGDYILYLKDKIPYLYNLKNKASSTFDTGDCNFGSSSLFTMPIGQETFLVKDSYSNGYFVLNARTKKYFREKHLPGRININSANKDYTEMPEGVDIIYSDINNIAYFYDEKEGKFNNNYRFSGEKPVKTFFFDMVLYNKYSNKYLFTYLQHIDILKPEFRLINEYFPKQLSLYGVLSTYFGLKPYPYMSTDIMTIYDLF